jgi:hypothetical protein
LCSEMPEGLIVYNQTIAGVCPPGEAGSGAGADASPWWTALGLPSDVTRCATRGLAVTLAIALHNIPEGMAVASPIYASTGSRWEAMKWCLLSSLCEPAAALLLGLLFSSWLTPAVISTLNAGVAGIMVCLCLIELIPAAAEHVSPRVSAGEGVGAAGAVVVVRRHHGVAIYRDIRAIFGRVRRTRHVQHTAPLPPLVLRCVFVLQAAALSNIAGQAIMFLSLYFMRSTGVH